LRGSDILLRAAANFDDVKERALAWPRRRSGKQMESYISRA